MPKTKRIPKKQPANSENASRKREMKAYMEEFNANCKRLLENVDVERDIVLDELEIMTIQCKALIPPSLGNTALEDLPKELTESINFITVPDTTGPNSILQTINDAKSVKIKKSKRSASAEYDKGYLTVENSEHSGCTRMSRSKTKQSKVVRASRSLSKSKLHKTLLLSDNYKTPINKASKNDYGFVTPKVKPNTPQVILRRPVEGEMAISMQGSPLMVNTIVSRGANVNIPLEDGRTISIQPQHGLRMSQLPDIDLSIRRQIEVLRDNLIKVCEFTNSIKNQEK